MNSLLINSLPAALQKQFDFIKEHHLDCDLLIASLSDDELNHLTDAFQHLKMIHKLSTVDGSEEIQPTTETLINHLKANISFYQNRTALLTHLEKDRGLKL